MKRIINSVIYASFCIVALLFAQTAMAQKGARTITGQVFQGAHIAQGIGAAVGGAGQYDQGHIVHGRRLLDHIQACGDHGDMLGFGQIIQQVHGGCAGIDEDSLVLTFYDIHSLG